jgi:hypothetical protein
MLIRGIAAGVILLALGQVAAAGEKPNVIHRVSCTVVRFYVARYSEAAAEMWARGHGASDAEIETARQCLSSSTVHTASMTR